MLRAIDRCRACENPGLVPLLSLGEQALTGIFPRDPREEVFRAPLELVKCTGEAACGLVQLRHTCDLHLLYGRHYGYRSSLNGSMVRHLRAKVEQVRALVPLAPGDLVLDVGSNDATLLKGYPADAGLSLVGIDPTGLTEFYPPHIELIPEFFSVDAVRSRVGARRARVVTSIAMFYDLEAPLEFARAVAELLADDGVWVFEQSYTPDMLRRTAYDTICHEHLEYYALTQVKWLLDRAGLVIVDVELNDVNGGSFSVTAARRGAPYPVASARVDELLRREAEDGLRELAPYEAFRARVWRHRDELRAYLQAAAADGRRVLGYGASTKGNVVLQFCGLGPAELPCIAEVNADKFGCFTPGTRIPIVSEEEARARDPDVFMVMPWHFRRGIVERERPFLGRGKRLLFPLPALEEVGLDDIGERAR